MSDKVCENCDKKVDGMARYCPECGCGRFKNGKSDGGFSCLGAAIGAAATQDLSGAIFGGLFLGD